MKKYKVSAYILTFAIYVAMFVILYRCFRGVSFSGFPVRDLLIIGYIWLAGMFMGVMEIDTGNLSMDLTDSVFALIFMVFGIDKAIIFAFFFWTIIDIIKQFIFRKPKKNYKWIYAVPMYVISAFSAAFFTGSVSEKVFSYSSMGGLIMNCFVFIGVFLIVNIAILKMAETVYTGKLFRFGKVTSEYLFVNFMASSISASTLYITYKYTGVMGGLLVILSLLMIHYCLFIYRKLIVKNESIKKLLAITENIMRYGELKDKCKNLIDSLNQLIPYNVCAIYTFDIDEDTEAFPIAYSSMKKLDIGELCLSLSETAVTIRNIKNGKIYFSENVKKDRNVAVSGVLYDITEALVMIPISVSSKIEGLILIGGSMELGNMINDGIEDILNILSNQMALALENDKIFTGIKSMAEKDHLTELFNRRFFDQEIKKLIGEKRNFSLVIYDIDDFKRVNDTFGHLMGDRVLINICDVIRKSIRKTDVACRYGGEEIVVIFNDLSKEDALIISERIRRRIEEISSEWTDNSTRVTISGGVASYPEDGESFESIIGMADELLYKECKCMGKNKVCALRTEKRNDNKYEFI